MRVAGWSWVVKVSCGVAAPLVAGAADLIGDRG
jgi:hypothetical protein